VPCTGEYAWKMTICEVQLSSLYADIQRIPFGAMGRGVKGSDIR